MFRRSRQGAVHVVHGSVPLNGETSEQLVSIMEQCFGEGPPRVVFDMQDVPLLDSLGLETLLSLQENFESRAGIVKLAAPSPLCRDILMVTGVGNQFEVFAEVKTAVGSFLH